MVAYLCKMPLCVHNDWIFKVNLKKHLNTDLENKNQINDFSKTLKNN